MAFASARPHLTRATAVAVAAGVTIALGALLPWYVAPANGARADAFAAGHGVLAAAIVGFGVVIAAAALVAVRHAWAAVLAGALAVLALGISAAGDAAAGLRHAGVDPTESPLGHHPAIGVNLLLGGAVVALAAGLLLRRETR
jgi:hypothetical protein